MNYTEKNDKSKTYQNQLNKLLARCKKGYFKEAEFFDKIEKVKSAGYKIDFEVNRIFGDEDFDIDYKYGIELNSKSQCITGSRCF